MTFEKNNISFRKYWDIQLIKGNNLIKNPDELESILDNVIKKEMISDVPIGSFLSGGIDSSLVTALMVKNAKKPINTFSIGFENNDFDESQHARKVANHLGTVHFEKIIDNNDLFDSIPKFSEAYDEPFADSSAIPTLVLSEMARNHVTVALSGDGADELFGGYRRYFDTNKYWNKIEKIPYNIRSFSAKVLKEFSSFSRKINKKDSLIANKLLKYNKALTSKNINELYDNFILYWDYSINKTAEISDIQDMMRRDIKTYLVDDIMTKVDRATMFNSLESRAPFLNHNVVEFALNLNINELISNGYGKIPLRKILSKYVPDSIINRPKMGFGVPLNDWLNGPLKNDLFKKIDLIEIEIPEICFELDLRNQVGILLKNGHSLHKVWLVYSLGLWFDKWNEL
jgi:asparagine synthase (glutamine-hydrolysing)